MDLNPDLSYLQLFLQGSSGALTTVLIHHHHHVGQRVHLHLFGLQVVLEFLFRRTYRPIQPTELQNA